MKRSWKKTPRRSMREAPGAVSLTLHSPALLTLSVWGTSGGFLTCALKMEEVKTNHIHIHMHAALNQTLYVCDPSGSFLSRVGQIIGQTQY